MESGTSCAIVDGRPHIFEEAAKLWEEMELPPFEVKGWSHGEHRTWTVPALLKEAAERLKENKDST